MLPYARVRKEATIPAGPLRLLLLLALPGCAAAVPDSSQNLTVTTNPPGASCRLERDGTAVAVANPTPATVRVTKGRSAIIATCTREGYDPTTHSHTSKFGGAAFANVRLGSWIRFSADVSSSNYPYPPEFVINLQPTGGPPVSQPENR
jgi:hypothetical protein